MALQCQCNSTTHPSASGQPIPSASSVHPSLPGVVSPHHYQLLVLCRRPLLAVLLPASLHQERQLFSAPTLPFLTSSITREPIRLTSLPPNNRGRSRLLTNNFGAKHLRFSHLTHRQPPTVPTQLEHDPTTTCAVHSLSSCAIYRQPPTNWVFELPLRLLLSINYLDDLNY